MTAVIEKPMLFSGPMVRAILYGSKTQTRRVVLRSPEIRHLYAFDGWCEGNPNRAAFKLVKKSKEFPLWIPFFGVNCKHPVGSRVWVRETYRTLYDPSTCREGAMDIDYRADGEDRIMDRAKTPDRVKWKPGIFMPRWASRITLEITAVRVERLQDISAEDCIAEGISLADHKCDCEFCSRSSQLCPATQSSLIMAYAELWDSINGKGAWGRNEFVWAYSFKRIKP